MDVSPVVQKLIEQGGEINGREPEMSGWIHRCRRCKKQVGVDNLFTVTVGQFVLEECLCVDCTHLFERIKSAFYNMDFEMESERTDTAIVLHMRGVSNPEYIELLNQWRNP